MCTCSLSLSLPRSLSLARARSLSLSLSVGMSLSLARARARARSRSRSSWGVGAGSSLPSTLCGSYMGPSRLTEKILSSQARLLENICAGCVKVSSSPLVYFATLVSLTLSLSSAFFYRSLPIHPTLLTCFRSVLKHQCSSIFPISIY